MFDDPRARFETAAIAPAIGSLHRVPARVAARHSTSRAQAFFVAIRFLNGGSAAVDVVTDGLLLDLRHHMRRSSSSSSIGVSGDWKLSD